MGSPTATARWAGSCWYCGTRYQPGAEIAGIAQDGKRWVWGCPGCADVVNGEQDELEVRCRRGCLPHDHQCLGMNPRRAGRSVA